MSRADRPPETDADRLRWLISGPVTLKSGTDYTWVYTPETEWHHRRDLRCRVAQWIYRLADLADRIDPPSRHRDGLATITIEMPE